MENDSFSYSDERFADLQMLRYRLNGFDELSLRQKKYIYCLAEATLCGRDITTDQFGKYNLRIRKALEAVFERFSGDRTSNEFHALEVYLKRVWFSNGIYHHYGCEKFVPDFSREFLVGALKSVNATLSDEVLDVMFNPEVLPKRVNKADGDDLVLTSACNFYEGVTQEEVETFYDNMKNDASDEPPSYGLNSKLVSRNGQIVEERWTSDGLYAPAIRRIVYWLEKACEYAENEQQKRVIDLLVKYYHSGDLHVFDEYSIEWLKEQQGQVDFINGFIEVYGDPLGLKGSWEGIVEYKDLEATRRTRTISDNAQWFEDHSPVDDRFKKKTVKGVVANVVCAAMLGGDEYPSTAIGINLPNADWIRARYGSKSVTIGNLTDAYNKAAHGNGFKEEFVIDMETLALIDQYGDLCDDLHTDLHECLGHGSGQLLPTTDPDALKAYGNTIEEARADLFGLYYIGDEKLVELGLLPNIEAHRSQYYTYLMNGLMTQLVRIKPGHQIEEAHMRNRSLIAHWVEAHAEGAVVLTEKNEKTYVEIRDYGRLRGLFARLLAEVQRIKSEGDYEAARQLVETYGVRVDEKLHDEILTRYRKLDLAPYKGFINPRMSCVYDADGNITDIEIDYTERYADQMMRYSRDYGFLSDANDVAEKVREIKRSFRLEMNGITSRSMREKGVGYHLNWGVPYVRLQAMAKPYGHDAALALALWQEDIRECKIMATLIMPPAQMTAPLADEWMSQVKTQEMAEMIAFNLLQHMDGAQRQALRWVAGDNELAQIVGFHVLSRLLRKGCTLSDAGQKTLEQAAKNVMANGTLGARHAAANTLLLVEEREDKMLD